MNNSIYKFSLDVHETSSQVLLELKQNDSKREFCISLTENGRPYVITENCHAVFTAKKPDGKKIFDDCIIDGNVIRYAIEKSELTAVIGEALCEIRLYGAENELLTSPTFTVLVNETVYQDGDIVESSDEFPALTSLYTKTNALYEEVSEKLKNGELKGKDGADGKDGINGADGKNGETGKSAYEIAVKNGFEGSEEEWLDWLYGPVYNTKKYNDIIIGYKVDYKVAATNDSFPDGTILAKFSDLPETRKGTETTSARVLATEIDKVLNGGLVPLNYSEFGNASVRYSLPDYGNCVIVVDESDINTPFAEESTGCDGITVFPESGIYVLVCFANGQSGILVDDAEISIVFKGEIKKLDSDYLFVSDQVRKDSEYLITSGGVFAALPTKLSELDDDETHRTVTDAEKAAWNTKTAQGDYTENDPSQPDYIKNRLMYEPSYFSSIYVPSVFEENNYINVETSNDNENWFVLNNLLLKVSELPGATGSVKNELETLFIGTAGKYSETQSLTKVEIGSESMFSTGLNEERDIGFGCFIVSPKDINKEISFYASMATTYFKVTFHSPGIYAMYDPQDKHSVIGIAFKDKPYTLDQKFLPKNAYDYEDSFDLSENPLPYTYLTDRAPSIYGIQMAFVNFKENFIDKFRISNLKDVSYKDNGKFLMVVEGKIATVAIPNITEEVF